MDVKLKSMKFLHCSRLPCPHVRLYCIAHVYPAHMSDFTALPTFTLPTCPTLLHCPRLPCPHVQLYCIAHVYPAHMSNFIALPTFTLPTCPTLLHCPRLPCPHVQLQWAEGHGPWNGFGFCFIINFLMSWLKKVIVSRN